MPSLLSRKPSVALASSFNIDLAGAQVSNVNFTAPSFNVAFWNNVVMTSSLQDAEVVYATEAPLRGGTWQIALLARTSTDRGDVTIATSPDGVTFTDLTTVVCYAGSNTNPNRLVTTGLTMPQGTRYLRLKLSTKNASSTAYASGLQGLSGMRTGN